jgi:hypothetical protein
MLHGMLWGTWWQVGQRNNLLQNNQVAHVCGLGCPLFELGSKTNQHHCVSTLSTIQRHRIRIIITTICPKRVSQSGSAQCAATPEYVGHPYSFIWDLMAQLTFNT